MKSRVRILRGWLRRSRSSVLGPRLFGAYGASLLLVAAVNFRIVLWSAACLVPSFPRKKLSLPIPCVSAVVRIAGRCGCDCPSDADTMPRVLWVQGRQ